MVNLYYVPCKIISWLRNETKSIIEWKGDLLYLTLIGSYNDWYRIIRDFK